MERLSDVWAFPAGAGRAVAVSRIKFPEPAEVVIRVRSASALCNRRVRTLRASISPKGDHGGLTRKLAIIFLYLLAIESRKII